MKRILSIVIVFMCIGVAHAQTPMYTDGLMMPKKVLGNGIYYTHDQWTKYWEGTRNQENGNLGTVTTQSMTWMGAYGVTDKLSVVATLPYVWTHTSGGTLHGMQGVQDLMVAAKYNFWNLKGEKGKSALKFFGLFALSAPTWNYSNDLMPLTIGLGSKNIYYRLTTTYTYNDVWFGTLSGAYTWRSNVYLDRPAYFANGSLNSTNEVKMYDTFDFIVRGGYHKDNLHAELFYTQQNTLGGGDIYRWGPGFVSNRMNFSKAGLSLMYAPKQLKNIQLRAWGNYTFDGRNVGQSTTITAGAMYMLNFSKNQ